MISSYEIFTFNFSVYRIADVFDITFDATMQTNRHSERRNKSEIVLSTTSESELQSYWKIKSTIIGCRNWISALTSIHKPTKSNDVDDAMNFSHVIDSIVHSAKLALRSECVIHTMERK